LFEVPACPRFGLELDPRDVEASFQESGVADRVGGGHFRGLPQGVDGQVDVSGMGGSAYALDRFERQTAWPMLILSLAIIPLLVIPLAVDVSTTTETVFFAIDWLIWAAFAVEYVVRLYLAPEKWTFVRNNIVDLVVVVVPFLRPLRIARSARMLRLLRASRVGVFLLRGIDAIQDVLTRHRLHYTLLVATVVTIGAGVLVAEIERTAPDGNITSIPDGLWWAVTTITTIGYGDRYPTTAAGRGVAVVLMLVGVGLFGLLAGSLASFLIERGRSGDVTAGDIGLEDIAARLERIERHLDALVGNGQAARATEDERL
jgi:voltage-gated potassium channel